MELDPGTGANRQFEKQEKQAHPLVSEMMSQQLLTNF